MAFVSAVGLSSNALSKVSDPPASLRVLFVGNSLTATNDLPAVIQALARSRGQALDYQTLARPNYSLGDHWEKGDARDAIRKGRWDFVVLQQGPSALEESRELLLKHTRLFAEEIRRVGATPALYMVWPAASRRQDSDRVTESYRLAAEKVAGVLVPGGEALREAEKKAIGLPLFSADGFHPSMAGSYLVALVFYQRLFRESPVGLPALNLPPGEARSLQAIALEINGRFRVTEHRPQAKCVAREGWIGS